jgi:hypothetical protein
LSPDDKKVTVEGMRDDRFSPEVIESVWRKGMVVPGLPDHVWRRDRFGATIRRTDYGRSDTLFGWVVQQVPAPDTTVRIDHLIPVHWHHARLEKPA